MSFNLYENSPARVSDLIQISFATPRTKEDAIRTKPSRLCAAGTWLAWRRRWALSWMQLRQGLSWTNSCLHMRLSTWVSWGKSWAFWEKKRQKTASSYQTCCASCITLVRRLLAKSVDTDMSENFDYYIGNALWYGYMNYNEFIHELPDELIVIHV